MLLAHLEAERLIRGQAHNEELHTAYMGRQCRVVRASPQQDCNMAAVWAEGRRPASILRIVTVVDLGATTLDTRMGVQS